MTHFMLINENQNKTAIVHTGKSQSVTKSEKSEYSCHFPVIYGKIFSRKKTYLVLSLNKSDFF